MVNKLIETTLSSFDKVSDPRRNNASYAMSDILSLGFAMFHLKDPSLSAFRKKFSLRAENLERVYGVSELPGDTALREAIDKVNPEDLKAIYPVLIEQLRRKGAIDDYKVLDKYNVVSVDGTGHYCSGKQSCPSCMVKNHRNGTKTYYHQLLSAVLLTPQQSSVFPVATEAIVKQNGETKNDCEKNAAKRILPAIKKSLPDENILTVCDSLYANQPYIESLQAHDMDYIIGAKGLDYLHIKAEHDKTAQEYTWQEKGKRCYVRYHQNLPLNLSHEYLKVNYFYYEEYDLKKGKATFKSDWITSLTPDKKNIRELIQIARARWKIENETFNKIKNQGYELEHNYGHGKKHLATNLAILMFLAFSVDQVAQYLNVFFQGAKSRLGTFKSLWEHIRGLFHFAEIHSVEAIYQFITNYSGEKRLAIE